MKAIILAAGIGNRMRPLTDQLPKTLLKIGEKTLIENIIDSLIEENIHDIVVVLGHEADKLRHFILAKYTKQKFHFVLNPKYKETNNIYSLHLAINSIGSDDLILIESDLFYKHEVLKKLIRSPYANVALVDKFRMGMDGTVVTLNDGVITNVIPSHLQGADFDFSDKYKTLNIYKFSKDFCESDLRKLLSYYVSVIDDRCYYELILGIIIYIQRQIFHAEIVDEGSWAEVDDPNDLAMARYMFSKKDRWELLESTHGGLWQFDLLDFYYLRNQYFPNSSVVAEIRSYFDKLMHNYGSSQDVLNEKMSYFLLCSKEYLLTLNGASQAYPILRDFFNGKRVLIPQPTFGEYSRVFSQAKRYSDYSGVDIQQLILGIKETDVVVVVNPNNPSGSALPTETLSRLAQEYLDKMFIIDESFIDFSKYKSIIRDIEKYQLKNVIVLKSLSKVLGVPGMRLGFLYTHNNDFLGYCRKFLPIWNSNSFAEYFLEVLLKHRGSFQESIENTIKNRDQFFCEFSEYKDLWCAYPSEANYIHLQLNLSAKRTNEICHLLLEEDGIYVKDVSTRFSDGKGHLRVGVRTAQENKKFISALAGRF